MGKRKGGTLPCQKINKIDAYRKGEDPIKNTHPKNLITGK